METIKNRDHLLHQNILVATYQCQPSSQWRCGEGDERCVSYVPPFIFGEVVLKLEILEVSEEPDEIQDLSTRAVGLLKGEESKSG